MPHLKRFKTLFLIIAMLWVCSAKAENYYLSNTGNDSNPGTSPSTAWKSLAKLNSFKNLKPGDSVLFKRGDKFYGSMIVNQSGSALKPIVYSVYGTGAKPIISGFTTVNGWKHLGGNIWKSANAVSSLSTCNLVTIDGVNTAMGRYPNTGWRIVQSATNSSITDNTLPTIDWTGAELVTRKEQWIIDRDIIKSQSGGTINFTGSNYSPRANWGYFLQNDSRTLDAQNEWYYNPTTKKLRVYSTSSPTNVKIASADSLIVVISNDNIHFDSLSFEGANKSAIYVGSSANLSIQNCDFNFNYAGISSGNWGYSSDGAVINNCTFNNSQNAGIHLTDEFTGAIVTNNLINNTALLAGMSGSGDGQAQGIFSLGAGTTVKYNKIENTGYNGIAFKGTNTLIKNNFIDNACVVKNDGGGIYLLRDFTPNKIIESNIVINIKGAKGGLPQSQGLGALAQGIYSDGWSTDVKILNNTIANTGRSGVFINAGDNITVEGNTIYSSYMSGIEINDDGPTSIQNLSVKKNIVVEKNLPVVDLYGSTNFSQLALKVMSTHNKIPDWGTMDSNYYARPIDDNLIINIQPNGGTMTPGAYMIKNLTDWQSYSGYDSHSKKSPLSISDTSDLKFEYNATISDKTISLDGYYRDVTGETYNGHVILKPYSGVVLIKDENIKKKTTPAANAGPDQTIILPLNNVKLSGSGSSITSVITSYKWKKLAGPQDELITFPDSAITSVNNLSKGIYSFELKVTDNNGLAGRDTVLVRINAAANIPPVANAGENKIITLPVNLIPLAGSGNDADGKIVTWLWTKISGPASFNIVNAGSPVTDVSGLIEGIYRFELKVIDNSGGIGKDTVQVTVAPAANIPPIANAGDNKTIMLPVNIITLKGGGSDGDGEIVGYQWTKLSGPLPYNIVNAASPVTDVSDLVEGIYRFELKVIDNSGGIGKDTMHIIVNVAANIPPIANAGNNKTITLPVNIISLAGSGYDADGKVEGYLWTNISGPASFNIVNAASPVTDVSGLVEGIYQFELRVIDNYGGIGRDTLLVRVLTVANIQPVANAGPDLTVTLPRDSVVLNGSGTDVDGTIMGYLWHQISGPNSSTIYPPKSAKISITDLMGGTYKYELTVTDNRGSLGKDTMTLTVSLARTYSEPDEIKFYPNPLSDIGILETNSKLSDQNLVIIITDIEGKVMIRKALNPTQVNIKERINMAAFAKGIYTLTVYFGEINKKNLRIVKL